MNIPVQGGFVTIPDPAIAPVFVTATSVQTYASADSVLRALQAPGASWINGLLRADGTELALDPPPLEGVGILSLRSCYTMFLQNMTGLSVKIRHGIGVSNGVNPDKPLYPYLGVSHGKQDNVAEFETLAPYEGRKVTGIRWDSVDSDLQKDQPIPNWPKWTLINGSKGKPPCLVLCAACDTTSGVVQYRDVQFEQVAYWGMKLTRKL